MDAKTSLKRAVKAIVPRAVWRSLSHSLARRRMRQFAHLSLEKAFDQIYEQATWSNGAGELSGGGSYGTVADEYVEVTREFIKQNEIRTVLDIGCGDFAIGARIAPLATRYYACDVSARIIELNKAKFATLANVDFRQTNACTDALPTADLVTVRQVFQHLTNDQIEQVLCNIERSGARFALISEHVAAQGNAFQPNRDLPSHSADTRVALDSGVVLSAPPFSRPAQLLRSIPLPGYQAASGTSHETLAIFLLRL